MEEGMTPERGEKGGLFRKKRPVKPSVPEEENPLSKLEPLPVSEYQEPKSTKKPSSKDTEDSLPQLRFTQAAKSPEPIVNIGPQKEFIPESAIVIPYGEYTIVLPSDSKEIQILDKNCRKIDGLTNTQTMIVNWPQLKKRADGSEYRELVIDFNLETKSMSTEEKQRVRKNYLDVSFTDGNLQNSLIKFIRKDNKNNNSSFFPARPSQLDVSKLRDISVNVGNSYILFFQRDTQDWIGYLTQNSEGQNQPPRNWTRYDVVDDWRKTQVVSSQGDILIQTLNNLKKNENLILVKRTENGCLIHGFKDKLVVEKTNQRPFSDILDIGNNICEDTKNPGVIYYCSKNSRTIIKLDTAKEDVVTWQTETADLPQEYKNISNLTLDPTGNFFTFESNGEFVILAKDTLQEVKKIPKLYNGTLDNQGMIRGIDERGYVVMYRANFQEVDLELEKRKIAVLVHGLVPNLFKKEAAEAAKVETDQFQNLVPSKTELETLFGTQLQPITNFDDLSEVTEALTKLRTRLQSEGLESREISFITQGIEDSIRGKEHSLAAPIVAQGLVDLNIKLAGNLTIATIAEAKGDLAKLKSLEGLVDDATRLQIRALENQLGQQSSELFKTQGAVIERDLSDLVTGVRSELDAMVSMPDFADWQEFKLPKLVSRLGSLANDCPLEASETQKKILAARRQLQDLSREYETRFKEKYALVREKASEVMGERVGLMRTDMDSLVDRFRGRGFKNLSEAETYVRSSEALQALRTEIEQLARQNPDAAKELDRTLKVQIANIMFEIERGGQTTIAETGQQMERFGNTLFPKWEGEVHEKTKRQFSLVFIADKKSMGPGITPDKILGDIGIREINSRGKMQDTRLYEGMRDEDKYRLGSAISRKGDLLTPSYITQAEFREIIKDYADWNKGGASNLRREFNGKIQEIKNWYKRKQEIGKIDGLTKENWDERYRELLYDYASFSAAKHILIFNKIDNLKKAPETVFANGKGAVEKWENYWVRDSITEEYLEEMAQILKMQLKQQSGILTIRGTPGAGKDVLVSMFSFRTNRPYFPTDCTKWDTAYELSEDIVLESKDGASQTVHVPSTVLNGITTPGAIVYFNELHALTEPTQIFLHALTDAKRRITLKTSSGKVVKALDSVVLMASMNPQIKDPIEPALRDRMVFMDVDYPPLHRKKDPDDPNPNPPIGASEALRIARDVNSLSDLTIESNMDRNEFVRMWDKYVNGIDNGAASPSKVQEFDMNVILAIVHFANNLRENFKAFKSGRTQTASKALPVSLPATGRPLRDCAYALSNIPDEQKAVGDPEAVAKALLERWFLRKIDNIEDREKIKNAMVPWTSSKRLAA